MRKNLTRVQSQQQSTAPQKTGFRRQANAQPLDEIAAGRQSDELSHDPVPDDWKYYGIQPQVARMLDWFVRHHPATAAYTIGEIIGEATDRSGIPRKIAENTIETALTLDSELSHDIRDDFLARVFDPDKGRSTT